jgi:hypothetical protein
VRCAGIVSHFPHTILTHVLLYVTLTPHTHRYAFPITVTGYSTAADGSVCEVQAEADLDFAAGGRKPPKGVLNWVGQPAPGQEPEEAEVRFSLAEMCVG